MSKHVVSDHAVLRYLQNVGGVDIERVRRHIWDQCRGAIANGATAKTVGGISYKFADGHVTTVVSVRYPEPEAIAPE